MRTQSESKRITRQKNAFVALFLLLRLCLLLCKESFSREDFGENERQKHLSQKSVSLFFFFHLCCRKFVKKEVLTNAKKKRSDYSLSKKKKRKTKNEKQEPPPRFAPRLLFSFSKINAFFFFLCVCLLLLLLSFFSLSPFFEL